MSLLNAIDVDRWNYLVKNLKPDKILNFGKVRDWLKYFYGIGLGETFKIIYSTDIQELIDDRAKLYKWKESIGFNYFEAVNKILMEYDQNYFLCYYLDQFFVQIKSQDSERNRVKNGAIYLKIEIPDDNKEIEEIRNEGLFFNQIADVLFLDRENIIEIDETNYQKICKEINEKFSNNI